MLSFLLLTGVLVYKKARQPHAAKPAPETTAKVTGQEKKGKPSEAPESTAEPPPPIALAIQGPGSPESQDPAVAQVAEAPPPPLLPTAAEVATTGPNPTEALPVATEPASAEATPPPPVLNVADTQGEPPPLPAVDTAPAPPPAQEPSTPPLSIAEPAPPLPPPVEAVGAAAPKPDMAPLPVPPATAANELPAPGPAMPEPPVARTTPAPAAHATAIPSLTPAPTIPPEPNATADVTQYRPLPNAGKVALAVDKPLGPPRKAAAMTVAAAAGAAAAAAAARSAKTPAATESKARTIEPIEHIVQSGENFGTISKLYYGTLRYYRALWKANVDRVPVIDQLVVGTSVRIPPPEALDAKLIDSRADQPAPKPTPKHAKPPAGSSDSLVMLPIGKPSSIRPKVATLQPEPARPTHVVTERETLRGIARDTLGDAHRADEIYSLNRDVIDDPARLEPGTRLRLPADANGRSIRR